MANVSLREFCRMQQWNPGYGHKLKEQGRLVVVVENDRERIDVAASLERLAETADPAKAHMAGVNARQREQHRGPAAAPPPPPAPAPAANSTYQQAKTAREVFEAKTAELEYRKAMGEVVLIAAVRAEMAPRVAQLREALLALSARLAPVVAAETDPKKIRALLDAEHRAALSQVAGAAAPQ
jgi:hypothetical protein